MGDHYNEIPCVYFSASAEGLITEANKFLYQYLGYTADELIGRKLETIFTLSTRIFQQTHLYPLLQLKGQAEEIYITLKTKNDSHVPVLINAERKEKDGQIKFQFAGIGLNKRKKFEDEIIAAKKTAEKALNENTSLKATQEELQKQAEELDRQITLVNLQNQELKQLNHLFSHSLQEPLRKLLFYSSQIIETQDEKKIITGTKKINKAIEDISAKLKGVQQYAWLTNKELRCETIDLHSIILLVKKEIEQDNPGLSILLEGETIPILQANYEQMKFLIKEILLNAVRFRKPGNTVRITFCATTLLLNNFRQLTEKYKYAEFLKLEIKDSGIGFDDKYQEQAFQLFRKLHPIGGLGIGLSLCKKIMENHNGFISLESQKEIGTKVIMLLPVAQEKVIS